MSEDTSKPKRRILVSYGVDIDAIAGWLGSYKGEDSTSDISRGTLRPDIVGGHNTKSALNHWCERQSVTEC